jgi:hypothetical protein
MMTNRAMYPGTAGAWALGFDEEVVAGAGTFLTAQEFLCDTLCRKPSHIYTTSTCLPLKKIKPKAVRN